MNTKDDREGKASVPLKQGMIVFAADLRLNRCAQ